MAGSVDSAECDVSKWKNMIAISAGNNYVIGVTADGTVKATGNNDYGQCDVTSWTDVIAVSAGTYHTVGLKKDGTVIATKVEDDDYNYGQSNVNI